jgi:hypothetical protein
VLEQEELHGSYRVSFKIMFGNLADWDSWREGHFPKDGIAELKTNLSSYLGP